MAAIEGLKSMRIGCDHAVCCLLTKDDGSVKPTWASSVTELPGVMSININPNMSMETAFYDDGPGEVAATLGNIEVTFNKSALGPKEKSVLLGKTLTTDGLLVSGANDVAPFVALGFRTLKGDGTYRYVWLLKGKFSEPVDNNETRGESINFQSDEIVGRFVKTNWMYTVAGKKKQAWKTECDETSGEENIEKLVADWFTKVIEPDWSAPGL